MAVASSVPVREGSGKKCDATVRATTADSACADDEKVVALIHAPRWREREDRTGPDRTGVRR